MPHSNYSKIHDLLVELDREEASKDIFEFAEELQDKELESFAIWRPTEPGSVPVKTYCSTRSIRRLVRFAADLGFVELDKRQCRLTTIGRSALRAENYPRMLATHVAIYLKGNAGITYSEIKEIMASIQPPEVPLFDTIYRRILGERNLEIGEARFRMVLYLLERCGMFVTMTRKIYFAPEVDL